MNIRSAAREVHEFVRDLVKPWTDFTGHEDNIAKILRKHVPIVPYIESDLTAPSGEDIQAVEQRQSNVYIWAVNGNVWRFRIGWDGQPIIQLFEKRERAPHPDSAGQ